MDTGDALTHTGEAAHSVKLTALGHSGKCLLPKMVPSHSTFIKGHLKPQETQF